MLTKGIVSKSFNVYFDEMEHCRKAGAYWALLHVTVCLPDICAALQSANGDTTPSRYKAWCSQFAQDAALTPEERWDMRNKVLHQGHARTSKQGYRYSGYAFGQPAATGAVDHKRVDGSILHVDVGEFARETRLGVEQWINRIESNPSSVEALAVEKNLPSLVRVQIVRVTQTIGVMSFMKTN